MQRRKQAAMAAGMIVGALFLAAGCSMTRSPDAERLIMVADLADALREEALKLPDAGQRERLVSGLIQIRELMTGDSLLKTDEPAPGSPRLPGPEGADKSAPPWTAMFAPASLVIGFFTRSRDFDGIPGDDGMEVRVQPLDQFGDPAKAVGSYRIEVFQYRVRTSEKKGDRLGHWFVSVLDAESNRKFYDPVDRSYVFPLLWEAPIEAGAQVIVQATFYPPGGFQEKLFAQRVIKIGQEQ
jgi:hypothetical protein